MELCSDDMAADDTDEEEKNTSKMRKYEKKIDTLMNEVGALRNEVRFCKLTAFLSVNISHTPFEVVSNFWYLFGCKTYIHNILTR